MANEDNYDEHGMRKPLHYVNTHIVEFTPEQVRGLCEELETLKAKVKEYLIVDEDEDREQDPSEKLRELAKELWELGK